MSEMWVRKFNLGNRAFYVFGILIPALIFSGLPSWAASSKFPRLRVGVAVVSPIVNATSRTQSDRTVIAQPQASFPPPSSPSSYSSPSSQPSSHPAKNVEFSGIAIDIWENLAEFNKLNYDYYPVVSVDQGIRDLAAHKLDVLIGPITITSDRLRLVAFTQPYLNSHLAILVHEETPTFWTIIHPFLRKAAIASIIIFLLIHALFANLLWLAEHRKNAHQFPANYWQGMVESLWFISVTTTTVGYGDKVPITHLGRLIAFLWMWLSLVLTTAITAGLATTLTLSFSQQINAKYGSIEDLQKVKVSTVKNLVTDGIIKENNLDAVEMPTLTEAINLFLLHEVKAVLFSENSLRYFIQNHPNRSLKIIPFDNFPLSYGFAVPPNSPYLNNLNVGIAQMTEERSISRIVNKWIK